MGIVRGYNLVKGWLLIAISGLFIVSAALLVWINWGEPCGLHFFTKPLTGCKSGVLMLLSALGGVVAVIAFRMLWSGIKSLYKGKPDVQVIVKEVPAPAPSAGPAADTGPSAPADEK